MFYSLQIGQVEGVMLDRFKAYYYLQTTENDHFRVALQIDYPLEYSVALVGKRFPEITGKRGCLAKYFPSAHNRLDRLIKHYISPVKVFSSDIYMETIFCARATGQSKSDGKNI